MKFNEILPYLKEQEEEDPILDPNAEDDDDNDIDLGVGNDFDNQPQDEPLADPVQQPPQEEQPEGIRNRPNEEDRGARTKTVKKKLSAMVILKNQWKKEAEDKGLDITEMDIIGSIDFFNTKKNGLRALSNPPDTDDIPQLYALQQRFPNFHGTPRDNSPEAKTYTQQKVRDIQSYGWEEIRFFIQRYVDDPLGGDDNAIDEGQDLREKDVNDLTPFIPRAMKQWKDKKNKIYESNGLTVIVIESKQQSINYGFLENALRYKHHRSQQDWCTTWTNTTNMYPSYRKQQSFYYCLNENVDESDRYRVFSISVFKPGEGHEQPEHYRLVNTANNSDEIGVSWEHILEKTRCPELNNVKDKLVWFVETQKESIERIFDRYTFDGSGGEYDFLNLRPAQQRLFIERDRNIMSAKALKSLGKVTIGGEKNIDLQYEYARRVTKNNMLDKFTTSDPSENVFDMLDVLRPGVKSYLNSVLIEKELVPEGIHAITTKLLETNLTKSFIDEDNPVRLFQSKQHTEFFGVYHLDTHRWIKPINYTRFNAVSYSNPQTRERYTFIKYVSEDDYFYWVFKSQPIGRKRNKFKQQTYVKGHMYEGNAGDELKGTLRPYSNR